MTIRLLETKFHIPAARDGEIKRPRLIEELNAGLQGGRRLTLVSAPAGYGKTTLVAGWLAGCGADRPRAWLSLDESDNDPARFMGYFLTAFNRLDEEAGGGALRLLGNPGLPPLHGLMDELINGLASRTALLVLDDYHILSNPVIHEALEYFIEHQPRGVHLVITTREDPPLPLARMRARGQITEVRARDLRFTTEEAGEFFRKSMRLDLTTEVVGCLEDRTEGWAAGLQLAALTLRNLPDPRTFLKTFSGSHRFVLDYLAEEVIRQQSEEVREFLSRTSVLERMNADSCQALTGRSDCQEILTRLEQANLFIIPLDDERNWYRYHHLFADYLRTGLSKDEASELHRKASRWHEENGLIFEAVRFAMAGGEVDFAAEVVERTLKNQAAWSGGQITTLAGWLKDLPPSALAARPMLSLHASRIMYLCGRNDAAEGLIDQAETSLAENVNLAPDERKRIEAYAALYRGGIAALRGDCRKAVELTVKALDGLPLDDQLARARASYSLGLAYELMGDADRSDQAYRQTADLAVSAGVMFLAVNVHGAMAQAQVGRGNLRRAEKICRRAVDLAGDEAFGPLGLIWSILGGISLEMAELDAAGNLIHTGLEISRRSGLQDDLISGMIMEARLRAARGDTAAAVEVMEKACSMVDAYGVARLSLQASALLARFQLADGRLEPALSWARQFQAARGSGEVDYLREFEDLTLARVLAAAGERQAVPAILDPVLNAARAAGRVGSCLDAMIQRVSLEDTAGERAAALEWLEEAVRMAAPEKSCRIFLDEGPALDALLPAVKSAAPEFVERLLEKRAAAGLPSPSAGSTAVIPDPLSGQELRVLKLIVEGKSNAEIAEELVISVGTAKWHVHHVLRKLGAGSRAQAIARARELGL